jgi:hypothetical protein
MTDYQSTGATGGWPPESDPSYPRPADESTTSAAGTATDEARNVAGTAVDQTKSVARTAADEARGVAQDAKGEVRKLVGDARSQLRSQVGQQSDRLAGSLQDVGYQLRTMAEKADDPESPVTTLTRQAADTADRVASRLQDGGFDQVVDDVKRFARNRPGVFLACALSAGFIVGRIVKAVDVGQVVKGDEGPSGTAQELYGSGTAGSTGTSPMTDEYQSFATSPGGTSPGQPYEQPATAYPVPEATTYPGTEGTHSPAAEGATYPGEPRSEERDR